MAKEPTLKSLMVGSDELPKAPSKERKREGKSDFFFENLSLAPETSAPKEHFKLVFGSGTSDLAKIRPLKVGPPAINWKSSLYENFHLFDCASRRLLHPAPLLSD